MKANRLIRLLFVTGIVILLPIMAFAASYTLTDDDVYIYSNHLMGVDYDNATYDEVIIPGYLDGQTVYYIDTEVFMSKGLSAISLPSGLREIGIRAFYDNNLSSISLPSSDLITISSYAFSQNSLSSLSIPSTVNSIGSSAFSDNDLTSLTIPLSVAAIGVSAFENNNLSSVVLPKDDIIIYHDAFSGNAGLSSIALSYDEDDAYTYTWYKDDVAMTPGTDITVFSSKYECIKAAKEFTITYHLDGGTNNGSNPATYTYDDNITLSDATKPGYMFVGWFTDPDLMPFHEITQIFNETGDMDLYAKWDAEYTFNTETQTITGYSSYASKTVSIPSSIEGVDVLHIGDSAFAGLAITSVSIPDGIETIGNYAFCNNGLTTLELPNSVSSTGWYSFAGNDISTLILSSAMSEISGSCFSGNSFSSLTIPGNIEIIGENAFSENLITTLDLSSNGVSIIGDYAFQNNAISSLTLSESLTEIGMFAFRENSIAGTLNIPGNVITIDSGAFSYNDISAVTLNEGIETIYNVAFAHNSITSVSLPTTLNAIIPGAFYDNDASLTHLDLPWTQAHYTVSWELSGVPLTPGTQVAVSEEVIYNKVATPIDYTITYYLDGGTNNPSNPASYNIESETITLLGATKTGKSFGGWYDGSDFETASSVTEIAQGSSGDVSLYAKWLDTPYTLYFDEMGGIPELSDIPFGPGSVITLPDANDITKSSYTLKGWSETDTGVTVDYDPGSTYIGGDADDTLYAVWATAYTLFYDEMGGAETLNDEICFDGKEVTLPDDSDLTKTGYSLEGWTTNSAAETKEYDPGATYTMGAADTTLYAVWSAIDYTLTYDEKGGTETLVDVDANYEEEITLPDSSDLTKTGYVLLGWATNSEATEQEYSPGGTYVMPADDITLYAVWRLGDYILYLDEKGGVEDLDDISFAYGDTITLPDETELTKEGYTLQGWQETDGAQTYDYFDGEEITIYREEDFTLYAFWGRNYYNVTYYENDGLSTIATDDVFLYGEDAGNVLKDRSDVVSSDPNYVLDGWALTADATESDYDRGAQIEMPAHDVDLFAVWTEELGTLTYEENGGSALDDVVVTGDNNATYINLPNIEDTSKSGYYLLGWSLVDDDSIDIGDYNPGGSYQLTSDDVTLYAVWREAAEIDFNEDGGYELLDNAMQTYSGEWVQLPDNMDLTKRGYILHGWADEAVSTNIYGPGEWIAYPEADITLRAIWKTRASGVTQNEDFEGSTPTSHVVNVSQSFYSGYKGTAPDVVIPTTVTTPNYSYENLTMIGPSALTKNTRVKTVEIASGYTTIGNFAFADNPYLTVVKIPASVTSIGVDAFAGNAASFAIEGELGSYAQTYAFENGILFKMDVEGLLTTELNKTSPDKAGSYGVATFEPTISGIPEGMTVRYTLKYSINGGKTFIACDGYQDAVWVPGSTLNFTFPLQTRDYTYTFEMDVTLEGIQGQDTSDREQVVVSVHMPLASVSLADVENNESNQVIPIDGITLTASADNADGYSETPTYRFAYRMQGSAKWAYINKAFSEVNTIQFMPKTEGVYYFKVEAQSLGRKTKAGDVWDYDYTAYTLSKTAEPVKGIYNLTSDKKDYVNGETVTLTMDATQNVAEDDAEYQLLYSTNGKSFKPFSKVYTPLTIDSGEAEIDVPALPLVKKDTIYYLKVQVRTVGRLEKLPDAFAVTQVEFKTAHPVEAGEVDITHVGNNDSEQSIDITGIVLVADFRADTEYRFGYQKLGSPKWAYISSKWSNYNEITFVPKTDGRYQFKVEARSVTRTTTDMTSITTDYYGLYYTSLGAVSAEIEATEIEFINDPVAGIEVPVIINAEGNGTDTYDIRVLYSTNGKRYKELGSAPAVGPEATEDWVTTLILPAVSRDTHYWIKIEAKTTGHLLADVFGTTEVDVYMVDPLTSMDSFVSNASGGVKLLPTTANSLTLTAAANDDAVYKFYYREAGTDKWKSIATKYIVGGTASFRPSKEGTYEYKAEATALGRKAKTADVSLELSETIEIWFTALPAETADMTLTDDDNDYIIGLDAEMNLQLDVTGNDDDMEYQIVYSSNGGKSYKPLSAWQTLTSAGDGSYVVTCPVPLARKDTAYLIKSQLRTTGRTTVDAESDATEVWMLAEERNVTTEISISQESYEYTDTIKAQISISEPKVSGDVEYQLQYSTNNKKWYTLSAHDWTAYDDDGTDYILVNLNLAEISGDTLVYIKVNARMKNSAKIEDFAIDSFMVYNIAPLTSVDLSATLNSTDVSVTLEASASGGIGHTREYMYSYALAGQKKTTWITFTSWIESDTVTFTPSLTGDYLFRVEARSKGRLKADVEDTATNASSGYYLKSLLE